MAGCLPWQLAGLRCWACDWSHSARMQASHGLAAASTSIPLGPAVTTAPVLAGSASWQPASLAALDPPRSSGSSTQRRQRSASQAAAHQPASQLKQLSSSSAAGALQHLGSDGAVASGCSVPSFNPPDCSALALFPLHPASSSPRSVYLVRKGPELLCSRCLRPFLGAFARAAPHTAGTVRQSAWRGPPSIESQRPGSSPLRS